MEYVFYTLGVLILILFVAFVCSSSIATILNKDNEKVNNVIMFTFVAVSLIFVILACI